MNESFVQVEASYQSPKKLITIDEAMEQVEATFAYEKSKLSYDFADVQARKN